MCIRDRLYSAGTILLCKREHASRQEYGLFLLNPVSYTHLEKPTDRGRGMETKAWGLKPSVCLMATPARRKERWKVRIRSRWEINLAVSALLNANLCFGIAFPSRIELVRPAAGTLYPAVGGDHRLIGPLLSLIHIFTPGLSLRGDEGQLRRLVMILLDNAVKYAGPGGTVTLTLERHQERLRLAVHNTGEPIPPEHLPHLFERFYRADAARNRSGGGYGLGLAIARSIVEGHHGRLTVTSLSLIHI